MTATGERWFGLTTRIVKKARSQNGAEEGLRKFAYEKSLRRRRMTKRAAEAALSLCREPGSCRTRR
jgi:hypothetical protein